MTWLEEHGSRKARQLEIRVKLEPRNQLKKV